MKNTNVKVKTSRRFIASICAIVAATAMVTGIAAFSASASDIQDAPVKPLVTASVKVDTKKAEVKPAEKAVEKAAEKKTETKTENNSTDEQSQQPRMLGFNFEAVKRNYELYEQAEKAQEATQEDQVNEYGKHPGECGYRYNENENAAAEQQTQQAPAEKEQQATETDHVNENGKHPGECGYGFTGKTENTAFPSGIYVDVNGTNAEIEIATYDGTTCYCTVTLPNGIGKKVIYGFMGIANGNTMEYTGGTKNEQTVAENGAAAGTKLIDKNHFGTVVKTDAGLQWQDNDGNAYVFAV